MSPDPRPPALTVLARRELEALEAHRTFWRRAALLLAIVCVALLLVVVLR